MILAGLGAAFGLLTRLPMWRVLPAGADGRDGVWAYAPVGGVIGLLGGGVYAGLAWTGMPPALAASWTVAAGLLITGGLHEDGLADMADGFGGGATRERKLAIMRDSRIGSYGASALVLALGLRGAAIAVLGDPSRVLVALVVAGAFARAAMVLVLAITPPARVDGLAAGLVRVSWRLAVGSAGFCLVLATVLVPWRVAVASLAVMAGVAMGLRWLALRQVGGHSGDVLGAIALVTECALLSLLARGW